MSRLGLALDHPMMESDLMWQATQSITLTRDGLLRAAVPCPIGECYFISDLTRDELDDCIKAHKDLCASYPRQGAGVDAYVGDRESMTSVEMPALVGSNL
jgi:3-dehydroquinate synthase